MISSVEIRNYRCFERTLIKGLKPFTILVGESGAGKTALLEALFLAGGANAEIYFRVRLWRGFSETVELTSGRASYEGVFRDLFHNFEQEKGAYIRIEDPARGFRNLEIAYSGDASLDLPLRSSVGSADDSFSVIPITFKWENPKRVSASSVEIHEGRLRMKGTHDVYPMTFVSPVTVNARQNALKYSELSKRNQTGPVINALRGAFPDIQDLSLEAVAGELMMHASLAGISEKLPIAVLSGGMNKYLSIALAVASTPGGVVLVDEIENGFYYRSLSSLLGTIWELCHSNNTQLIATTHSYEFLQSMVTAMDSHEGLEHNTALLRLEKKHGDTPPTVRLVAGSSYKAAIASQFEVR